VVMLDHNRSVHWGGLPVVHKAMSTLHGSWKEDARAGEDGSGTLLVPPTGSILHRRNSKADSGSDKKRSPSLNKRVTFFHSLSASTRSQAIRIHHHNRRPLAKSENGTETGLLPNGPERPDSISLGKLARRLTEGESGNNHRRRGVRSFADARSPGPAFCTKRLADNLRRRTIKHRRCFRFLWPVKFLLFNRQRGQQGRAGSRSSRLFTLPPPTQLIPSLGAGE